MSAMPFETVGSLHTLPTTRRFYVAMAALFVVIAFTAFIATYWAKVATGTFTGAPILHVHGALFFTWTLFFLMQTGLVASGRTPDHRAWGMAGISLATAMAKIGDTAAPVRRDGPRPRLMRPALPPRQRG